MRIVPIAIAACAIMLAAASGASLNAASGRLNAASIAKVNRATAARIMHERHEGMETIGKTFKMLHRELDASSPSLATVRAGSAQVASLAKKSSDWFPAGTGPEVGKTGAKPEIWQTPQDFSAKLVAFQKASVAFNAAASGSDLTAIKARYADLGGTCKACHDKYRTEMHH